MVGWLAKFVQRRAVSEEVLAGTEIPGCEKEEHNTRRYAATMIFISTFRWSAMRFHFNLSITVTGKVETRQCP